MLQVKAKVLSNGVLYGSDPAGAWLLWMDAGPVAEAARPGQFVMVRCGEGHDPLLRRPLGIHRVDSSGRVALLYGVAGRGTAWLSQRAPGDLVDVVGPLGNGFTVNPDARSLLLLAGGIGFTPLAFMAETCIRENRNLTLLMGARSAEYLYPKSELPQGINLVTVTEDGSEPGGRTGLVTQIVGEYAARADQVFACGPPAMYRAMANLECLKGKPVQLSLEERMACGLGACFGCTVRTRGGPRQVCHDGPVFEMSDIFW